MRPVSVLFFFGVRSRCRRSWVIPLGTSRVSRPKNGVLTQFQAEYVNKTRILTCMLEHLNRKKVLRAKILMQSVLKRQIQPRNFSEERCIVVYKF